MRIHIFFLSGLAAAVLCWSCAKDTPENSWPSNTSSNGMLQQYFLQRAPVTVTYSFDPSLAGGYTSNSQTTISWIANAFVYPNGQPVAGNVTMQFTEVLNKSSALYAGASTTSNGRPLISGGELKLVFMQGNQELEFANASSVFVSMLAGNSPMCGHGMSEFYADEIGLNTDFLQQSPDSIYYSDNPTLLGSPYVYQFSIDHPGWVNVDQMMSGEQTTFTASLPAIFDGSNSMVFVSYDGQFSIAQLYHYDETTHSYGSGTYYTLPIGVPVTFVAICEINGQFYYDQVSRTVTEELSISLNPSPATTAEIDQRVAELH